MHDTPQLRLASPSSSPITPIQCLHFTRWKNNKKRRHKNRKEKLAPIRWRGRNKCITHGFRSVNLSLLFFSSLFLCYSMSPYLLFIILIILKPRKGQHIWCYLLSSRVLMWSIVFSLYSEVFLHHVALLDKYQARRLFQTCCTLPLLQAIALNMRGKYQMWGYNTPRFAC